MEPRRTETDLSGLHGVLLEALTDIDELCRRHGLAYSLYCGTLLGAVREKDFIAWDDDADLMMPVRDYRRFFRIARRELGDRYEIQDLANTPAHPWLWMRVFRRNTTYLRRDWADLRVHHGIALDIYPMIGAAKTRRGLRLQTAALDLAKALRHIDYWRVTGYPEDRKQRRIGKLLAVIPGPVRRGLSRAVLRCAALPPSPDRKVCTLDGAPFEPKFDGADWQEYTTFTLAGRPFAGPARYDRLLRIMYGDYMTPPKESARKGHGADWGGAVIDTDRDYTEYLADFSAEEEKT